MNEAARTRQGRRATLEHDVGAQYGAIPNLTLLKLRAFRAVVERESLTAAAHALFVTEPVVNATPGTRLNR